MGNMHTSCWSVTKMLSSLESDERSGKSVFHLEQGRSYHLYLGCLSSMLSWFSIMETYRQYIYKVYVSELFLYAKSVHQYVDGLLKDGHRKIRAGHRSCSHSCSPCQPHDCVLHTTTTKSCHKSLSPKSQTRYGSFNFVHCQCGKCSLYGVINNTCPNGCTPASLLCMCANVYPAISANNGVLPADCGPGTLLQPKMAATLGQSDQYEHNSVFHSVDKGVKTALVIEAIHHQVSPDKSSLRIESTSVIDLILIFSDKSCLSCNDQIVHTELCTLSSCRVKSHSLTIAQKTNGSICISAVPSSLVVDNFSVIQHSVVTCSLIVRSGGVELNPGPTGIGHFRAVNNEVNVYDCKAVDISVAMKNIQGTTGTKDNKRSYYFSYYKREKLSKCIEQGDGVHEENDDTASVCAQELQCLIGICSLFSNSVTINVGDVVSCDSSKGTQSLSNTKEDFNKEWFGAEVGQSCNVFCWNLISTKYKPSSSGMVNLLLLKLAGDVEENPGPFGRSKSKSKSKDEKKSASNTKSEHSQKSLTVKAPEEYHASIGTSKKDSALTQPLPPLSLKELAVIPVPLEKWFEIGSALGVSQQSLNDINKSKLTATKKKNDMFKVFLKSSNPTWEKVICALQQCGQHEVVEKTCETFNLPLTLFQHELDPRKVVTTPVHLTERVVQSDSAYKSHSGRIKNDAGTVLPIDEQSTHRESSSGSSPLVEQCSVTKTFVDDADHNEPLPYLPETVVVTSQAKSSILQNITGSVSSDGDRKTASDNQPSSIFSGGGPKSDSLEYHSFSDSESGPLQLSEITMRPNTSDRLDQDSGTPSLPDQQDVDDSFSDKSRPMESGGAATKSSSNKSEERNEFHEAVVKNNLEKGNILLNRGLDPNCILEDITQQAGLHITCRLGHKEFVNILLKHKASVNLKDSNGCSPLYLAARCGNYEITKMIVALPDCDIHTVNKDSTPLLFDPSSKGFSMICELLLENGADPLAETMTGISPLYIASMNGHKDVVKVLLKHGADCTRMCMETSKTPLHEAIDSDHVEVVKILMKAVSKANKKNEDLFICKTAEEVRKLMKERALVDSRKADGRTPLIVHTAHDNKEVVQELIEHKANVDLQDNDGWSALMVASYNGYAVIVQHLIFAGAIPDLKSKDGLTALMYAVIKDHVKIVNELILAKADPSLKSNDGHTAFELAKDKEEILEVLKRHKTKTFGSDPLYNLLGSYLKKKEESTTDSQATMKDTRKLISSVVPGPQAPIDETNTAKEEVEKCYKRIADLETRIRDLTLRLSAEIPEYTDLNFLQRDRLEDEFRKLKELKRKAEQYAIEAKQTAQRLSAENFKLREDLSRERHHNELTRKNIIREIEQKVDRVASSEERIAAKREVFEQEVQQKAYQLLRNMPHGERRTLSKKELTPRDLKEFVFKQSLTVNLLELAIVGLPCSGKNELLDQILELKTSTTEARLSIAGVDVYEAIMHYNEVDESFAWIESTKEEAHVHTLATALAQVLARTQRSPAFLEEMSGDSALFDDPKVDEHFHATYSLLQKLVTRLEKDGSMEKLITTRLTLLNLVNVGVNKTAFEILGILARRCKNVVLLNVLDLERETPEQFNKRPDLSNEALYGGRYERRKGDENLLNLHTALHYYMQVVIAAGGSEQNGNVILVGTHKDKLSQGEFKTRKKYIEQTTMAYAEEVGIEDSICRDMECINAKDASDCDRLRKRIVQLIHHKKKFEFQIPISHIFFRCYLHTLKKLFISRKKLVKEALKCGITDDNDIETFLVVFNNCGSIVYSADGESPFLKEFVILDPFRFIEALDKLYYVDTVLQDKPQLYQAVSNSQYGFVSDQLASELWPGEGDGAMTEAQFFVHVLEDLDVIARIHPNQLKSIKGIPLTCTEGQNCYFMPSLRPKFDTTVPKFDSNSLFVVYNVAMIPFHLQSYVVLYLQSQLGDTITFDPKPFYNVVCFKWRESQQQIEANISVRFHTEHVEISVNFLGQPPRMSNVTYLFSTLKTFCIQMFQQISSHIKGFEYKLAIVCPHVNSSQVPPANVHYITFHPLAIKQKSFYCEKCEKSISSDQLPWSRLLWTQVAFNGTTKSAYQDDDFDSEEIAVISEYLASHHTPETLQNIVVSLGYKGYELLEKRMLTSLESLLHQLIFEWHCRNPSNSIKLFAQILYSCGCYREAIRLDHTLLNSSTTTLATHNPSQDLSRRELSCIVSHATKESTWKQVLQFLTIKPGSVRSLGDDGATHKTLSEQRFDSVKSFAISSDFQERALMEGDTTSSNVRKNIVQQLLRSDYTSLATNLEIGVIDARVPSNFLCNF